MRKTRYILIGYICLALIIFMTALVWRIATLPTPPISSEDLSSASDKETQPSTSPMTQEPERHPDFVVSINPSREQVSAGNSISYAIGLTSLNGFSSPVYLQVSNLPTGVSGSFDPPSVIPDGTSLLRITTRETVIPDNYSFKVIAQAKDKEKAESASLIINPAPYFGIEVTPTFSQISPGNSTSFRVSVTSSDIFQSTVSLSVSGLPGNAEGNFSARSLTPPGSSILNISTTENIRPGNYSLRIEAQGAGKSHAQSITLKVGSAPDFAIDVDPSFREIFAGSSTSFKVKVSSSDGFKSTVHLNVSGLPAQANGSFSSSRLTPSGSSSLDISTNKQVSPGEYIVTITAKGDGKIHTKSVTLRITSAPDFRISANPTYREIPAGSSCSYAVSLTSLHAFHSPITLEIRGLPSDVTWSFSPNPATPNIESILHINTKPSASQGFYTLTIKGTGGGKTHEEQVTLNLMQAEPRFFCSVQCLDTSGFYVDQIEGIKISDLSGRELTFTNKDGMSNRIPLKQKKETLIFEKKEAFPSQKHDVTAGESLLKIVLTPKVGVLTVTVNRDFVPVERALVRVDDGSDAFSLLAFSDANGEVNFESPGLRKGQELRVLVAPGGKGATVDSIRFRMNDWVERRSLNITPHQSGEATAESQISGTPLAPNVGIVTVKVYKPAGSNVAIPANRVLVRVDDGSDAFFKLAYTNSEGEVKFESPNLKKGGNFRVFAAPGDAEAKVYSLWFQMVEWVESVSLPLVPENEVKGKPQF